jgi:nitrite reductase/ring-hydroxylating ferredoxin subunit
VTSAGINRRRALTGAAVLGVGAPLLGACGEDETEGTRTSSTSSGDESPSASASGDAGGGGDNTVLATKADIPEGGGTVFKDQQVVVTQPRAGEFKAFDATCPHKQCIVKDVADDTINCGCHGAQYGIADGQNVTGAGGGPPDLDPLAERKLKIEGEDIFLA